MWKQMEGEGSRQAAPDGGSGGEEGSHTHCVVAVMGRIDFWLKDYYRTPKSGVQLHPPPPHQVSRPSEFCLLWALGRQLPLRLTKNTNKFMRALSSAHTRSSCGLGMSYTEVLSSNIEFWPRQGSHFPKPCAKNRGGGGGEAQIAYSNPTPTSCCHLAGQAHFLVAQACRRAGILQQQGAQTVEGCIWRRIAREKETRRDKKR